MSWNDGHPDRAVAAAALAWITETDMIEIDRIMIEDLHIELIQMMENAGRNLARLVLDRSSPQRVVVAAGSGGNGGGGLVAARHLANAGVKVTVVTTRPGSELAPVPAHQFDILRRMGVSTADSLAAAGDAEVIVDAIIGYSLRGAPKGRSATLIDEITSAGGRSAVVSLDTPSGLNVTTGEAPGPVVRAEATMTLCLPKVGLRSASEVGRLHLADISVPPSVTAAYGPPPDFRTTSILEVNR